MNERLEPRIEKLEEAYQKTSNALVRMERDFCHLTEAVEKITELLIKQEANHSAIKSAHHRIDKIDEQFSACQSTKVAMVDFKELKDSLKEVRDAELKSAWMENIGSTVIKGVLMLVVMSVVGLLFAKA